MYLPTKKVQLTQKLAYWRCTTKRVRNKKWMQIFQTISSSRGSENIHMTVEKQVHPQYFTLWYGFWSGDIIGFYAKIASYGCGRDVVRKRRCDMTYNPTISTITA